MRRIVSVWLPDWPVTVWSKAAGRSAPPESAASAALNGGPPFALIAKEGSRGLVLHALNPAARALGLKRGQAHADAKAIAPQLQGAQANPARDAASLRRLALWAERFSPLVAVDEAVAGSEGLFLDMTGGAHLFGGEAEMLVDIEARLARAGVPAHAAMADSPGAAWALARFGTDRLAEAGRGRDALAPLPIEALRLEEIDLRLLKRFGLKRIGDLYGLPRAGLARRFRGQAGLALVRRLDQALGAEPEPLVPVRPAPRYRTWRVFLEPLIDMEGVALMLPPLAEALSAQLQRDSQGARQLVLTAFRVDGRTTSIEAGLSAPSLVPAHLLRLLKERGLERLDLGFGADALMLSAVVVEPLRTAQTDLAPTTAMQGEDALAGLIDRIQARLGQGSVLRPLLVDSFIPERSERWSAAGPQAPVQTATEGGHARPLLLLDPPEPVSFPLAEIPDGAPMQFVWRRVSHKVSKSEGPERLSPEWWRPQPTAKAPRTRDYFRIEDEAGRRFWLFREGLYGREDAEPDPDPDAKPEEDKTISRPPTWWMHGVFA
jgi:protein ImuB